MLKKLPFNEINRRRQEFGYIPFCPGAMALAMVAVPLACIHLRTWKPLLYWIPALIFVSILPLDMGGAFVAAILINGVYSYITVNTIKRSRLNEIIYLEP